MGVILVVATLLSVAVAVRYASQTRKLSEQCLLANEQIDRLKRQLDTALTTRPHAQLAVPPPTVLDDTELAGNEGAEKRILELEAMLADRERRLLRLQEQQTNSRPDDLRRGPERAAWLEDLKVTDPDRYEAIMEQRELARDRVRAALALKAAHFLERDTSNMEEAEAAEHRLMLQLLDEVWSLAEELQVDGTREQRREIRHAIRDKMSVLQPMLDDERDREFYALGLEFGYSENESATLVDYLNEVIDITSMRPVFEAMRPGGFRGPGGPSADSNPSAR